MKDNGNGSELTYEEIKQLQREFLDALIWQLSLVSKGGE